VHYGLAYTLCDWHSCSQKELDSIVNGIRRLAELDIEDRKQLILTKQRQEVDQIVTKQREFYERMLQLGNHEVAAELLLEITRNIANERNRSTNRVGGV
jgi:hypothetical protein